VDIESRPGVGTTVRMVLPRTTVQPAEVCETEQAELKSVRPGASILIIDDDPDVRQMLVASVNALGYRVSEAPDGASGLAALKSGSPDLIMVDFAMPGMNGAELAKAAREWRPDLPIIFASGYSDTVAIEAVVGPNFTVLRKPFRVDELQRVLAATLADHIDPVTLWTPLDTPTPLDTWKPGE
jgi:CheY-like chemotaxis protein